MSLSAQVNSLTGTTAASGSPSSSAGGSFDDAMAAARQAINTTRTYAPDVQRQELHDQLGIDEKKLAGMSDGDVAKLDQELNEDRQTPGPNWIRVNGQALVYDVDDQGQASNVRTGDDVEQELSDLLHIDRKRLDEMKFSDEVWPLYQQMEAARAAPGQHQVEADGRYYSFTVDSGQIGDVSSEKVADSERRDIHDQLGIDEAVLAKMKDKDVEKVHTEMLQDLSRPGLNWLKVNGEAVAFDVDDKGNASNIESGDDIEDDVSRALHLDRDYVDDMKFGDEVLPIYQELRDTSEEPGWHSIRVGGDDVSDHMLAYEVGADGNVSSVLSEDQLKESLSAQTGIDKAQTSSMGFDDAFSLYKQALDAQKTPGQHEILAGGNYYTFDVRDGGRIVDVGIEKAANVQRRELQEKGGIGATQLAGKSDEEIAKLHADMERTDLHDQLGVDSTVLDGISDADIETLHNEFAESLKHPGEQHTLLIAGSEGTYNVDANGRLAGPPTWQRHVAAAQYNDISLATLRQAALDQGALTQDQSAAHAVLALTIVTEGGAHAPQQAVQVSSETLKAYLQAAGASSEAIAGMEIDAALAYVNGAPDAKTQLQRLTAVLDVSSSAPSLKPFQPGRQQMVAELQLVLDGRNEGLDGDAFKGLSDDEIAARYDQVMNLLQTGTHGERVRIKFGDKYESKFKADEHGRLDDLSSFRKRNALETVGKATVGTLKDIGSVAEGLVTTVADIVADSTVGTFNLMKGLTEASVQAITDPEKAIKSAGKTLEHGGSDLKDFVGKYYDEALTVLSFIPVTAPFAQAALAGIALYNGIKNGNALQIAGGIAGALAGGGGVIESVAGNAATAASEAGKIMTAVGQAGSAAVGGGQVVAGFANGESAGQILGQAGGSLASASGAVGTLSGSAAAATVSSVFQTVTDGQGLVTAVGKQDSTGALQSALALYRDLNPPEKREPAERQAAEPSYGIDEQNPYGETSAGPSVEPSPDSSSAADVGGASNAPRGQAAAELPHLQLNEPQLGDSLQLSLDQSPLPDQGLTLTPTLTLTPPSLDQPGAAAEYHNPLVPKKWAVGAEKAWNIEKGTESVDGYIKGSWQLNSENKLNVKLKYTPRASVPGPKLAAGGAVSAEPKATAAQLASEPVSSEPEAAASQLDSEPASSQPEAAASQLASEPASSEPEAAAPQLDSEPASSQPEAAASQLASEPVSSQPEAAASQLDSEPVSSEPEAAASKASSAAEIPQEVGPEAASSELPEASKPASPKTPDYVDEVLKGGWKPEKLSLDIGLASDAREIGLSLELKLKDLSLGGFIYGSAKQKDLFLDSAQVKVGKIPPQTFYEAATSLSLKPITKALSAAEVSVGGEQSISEHSVGSASVKANASTPGVSSFFGFVTGTAVNYGVSILTDKLTAPYLSNETARTAVDVTAGTVAGVAADTLATRLVNAAASSAPVAQVVGDYPALAATGEFLGTAARIGGPVSMVVVPALPDTYNAYQNYQAGDTTGAWQSVGRAAWRVSLTLAGAGVGTLLGAPIMGAIGGAILGDKLARSH